MKPMFVAMVIITVMVLPSVASDKTVFGRDNLTSDPWMVQGPAQANKPTHVIDGSTKGVNIVVGSMGEMGQANLDAYEAQNGVSIDAKGTHTLGPGITPRSQWDNSLGGSIGMAPLDSNYGIFGEPALKTTDPAYLSMGAQPISNQSSLPLSLQGGV